MFTRLRNLFLRYARQHREIEGRPFSLKSKTGDLLGHVDRVLLRDRKITFFGWYSSAQLEIEGDTGPMIISPTVLRPDVADTYGTAAMVGFEASLPFGTGHFTFTCLDEGQRHICRIEPVTTGQVRRNRAGLALRFVWTLLRVSPSALKVWRNGDATARGRVRDALGLQHVQQAQALQGAFLAPATEPLREIPQSEITIILPIYNAFDLLPEVLERVVTHTDLPWRLIAVEDCSSDPAVRPWLQDWVATHEAAHPGQVELILNAQNKGFIGSVNSALARAQEIGHHVVLLNSDAFVPAGWASRLLRPLLTSSGVATTTPMSNDAEIFSVPTICQRTVLKPGQGDAMDVCARALSSQAAEIEVPTGVGFCMAMNIDYIRQIPALDTVFGKGYGEEVDWCQKARALGGRHLAVPNLFVEHRGGSSFGNEAKMKLIANNNAIVSQRYPYYDREVQEFIAADPLATPRLALALAWAGSLGLDMVPVYVAHSMGGGAETYLQNRIRLHLEENGRPAVILRVGGIERWQLEVVSAAGKVAGGTGDPELVAALLNILPVRRLVYSCGVGDHNPVGLPDRLRDFRQPGDRLEVLVHDFFMVSPSYTLLDQKGLYHGPVEASDTDPAHQTRRHTGEPVTLAQWRTAWGGLLAEADEIVAFSQNSRDLVAAAYPDCAAQIVVRPHVLPYVPARLSPPPAGRRVIGVLGNIGLQKGAAVVADLARLLQGRNDLGLAVIGNIDPRFALPADVPVHGSYTLEDLPEIAARYGISDWLVPSIWPETFSYTTHEALATGLPVHVFDIGAQGEAVARAENGHLIPFETGNDLARAAIDIWDNQKT